MLLTNYLFFTTQCEPALMLYRQCGLGEGTELLRYGVDGAPPTDALHGKIMHARFEGPGILFHASDNFDAEPMRGSAHLLLMEDHASTDSLFALLSDGGRVTTPLGIQSWGDYFGKLTDRFGVQWMLNCPRTVVAFQPSLSD